MIVILVLLAIIQTEVIHARAMLDTQAVERFAKVWRQSMHDHIFAGFLKTTKNVQ